LRRLIFVLVEAAIELVPRDIRNHPSVISYARKRKKKPSEILLDRSYHHAAMKRLPNSYKRGRPDITHFTLLEVLGSPLNKSGLLETYIQTQSGHIIYIHSETRLPRIYERFKGLIEKLYREPEVKTGEKILLSLRKGDLDDIIRESRPDFKFLLSERGERMSWSELSSAITRYQRPMIMLGGFPRGEFEEKTLRTADKIVSIWHQPLEAWTVASRILCILECSLLQGRQGS